MTTLEEMLNHDIGMLTTVIIGNSSTMMYEGLMVTPRGYQRKYTLNSAEQPLRPHERLRTEAEPWSLGAQQAARLRRGSGQWRGPRCAGRANGEPALRGASARAGTAPQGQPPAGAWAATRLRQARRAVLAPPCLPRSGPRPRRRRPHRARLWRHAPAPPSSPPRR